MPYMCCVAKCPNSTLHPGRTNFSFHRFPKDESLSEQWMGNINRPNFFPTKHTRICSAHFEDWCFQRNDENDVRESGIPALRRSLKTVAVPTLFNKMILTRVLSKGGKKSKKAQQLLANKDPSSVLPENGYTAVAPLNGNNGITNGGQHSISVGTDREPIGAVSSSNGHGSVAFEESVHFPGSEASHAGGYERYELTELTPMVKREGLSPLPDNYGDHLQFRALAQMDDGNRVAVGGFQPVSVQCPPPTATALCFGGSSDFVRRCVISETFLYTLLRLIKCPQCGFGANPEHMHKYENQGCILGVRLTCYHGHLVLDWMV